LANQFAVVKQMLRKGYGQYRRIKRQNSLEQGKRHPAKSNVKANDQLDTFERYWNSFFECYALSRIHFLNARKKERSFSLIGSIRKRLLLDAHLIDTANKCDPKKGWSECGVLTCSANDDCAGRARSFAIASIWAGSGQDFSVSGRFLQHRREIRPPAPPPVRRLERDSVPPVIR